MPWARPAARPPPAPALPASGGGGSLRRAPDICHRHFGVGADGVILIRPSDEADARMQMFNADGSEAEMCGNGIRCLAKYVYDHGICTKDHIKVETGAGVLAIDLEAANGRVDRVRVDMGEPILSAQDIPTTLEGDPVVNRPLKVASGDFTVTCISMGNPHCIVFTDEITDQQVFESGPQIENAAEFPARVNVEFVQVLGRGEVRQRTWERGSGETWACGTGASAVCVAGVLTGRTERTILNHLLGGDLELEWNESSNHVFMTGPAAEVFSGEWY